MLFRSLGVVPVRFAELPEAAPQRVQAAGGHVDRAEAAVGRVIDGAELLRPPAGERLRLVAAGQEGQFVRVALADRRQRSEEHTSELQSIMRNSYAVFCLK